MAGIGSFEFTTGLFRHQGTDSWHFVTVPIEVSAEITDLTTGVRRGFGSVRVAATVGDSHWRTSVFPDRKAGTYLLPMKKSVRDAQHLEAGDECVVHLEIVDL